MILCVATYAMISTGSETIAKLRDIIVMLTERQEKQICVANANATRVLMTGCPVGGDVLKVLKLVDEEGAIIVGLDDCIGIKPYLGRIEEGSGVHLQAIVKRYLEIPCACMTPHTGKLGRARQAGFPVKTGSGHRPRATGVSHL